MKKLFAVLVLCILCITGCGKEKSDEKITIRVPQGTPLVACGGLLDKDYVEFDIVSGPTLLQEGLTKGEIDVIIAPINVGTKLYINGGSKYKLDSVIVSDNNYIVTKNGELNSINDLSGKDIIAYGQASTPGVTLSTALQVSEVTANVTYESSVALAVAGLTESNYALVAEPELTKLKADYPSLKVLDLGDVIGFDIPQAGVFVNPKSNTKLVSKFLKALEANITSLNSAPAVYADKVVELHAFFETMTVEVITNSIPRSNINYLKASENVTFLNSFYSLLNNYNSNILGGNTPNEDFYY